jgi:hypothetical protein
MNRCGIIFVMEPTANARYLNPNIDLELSTEVNHA